MYGEQLKAEREIHHSAEKVGREHICAQTATSWRGRVQGANRKDWAQYFKSQWYSLLQDAVKSYTGLGSQVWRFVTVERNPAVPKWLRTACRVLPRWLAKKLPQVQGDPLQSRRLTEGFFLVWLHQPRVGGEPDWARSDACRLQCVSTGLDLSVKEGAPATRISPEVTWTLFVQGQSTFESMRLGTGHLISRSWFMINNQSMPPRLHLSLSNAIYLWNSLPQKVLLATALA